MHLEFLVEGQSERTAFEPLLTKILGHYGNPHTWRIHKHRGLGRLPEHPEGRPNPRDPTLLHNLPAKLRAYGRSLNPEDAVVVLVDLDDRPNCLVFKQSLSDLLHYCHPVPNHLFRIAIEELEAWFFGDPNALQAAYPKARMAVVNAYVQDAQCGTWETLADAIYPGGSRALKRLGRAPCLAQKRIWARDIAPLMTVDANRSPSFQCFRDGIRALAGAQP